MSAKQLPLLLILSVTTTACGLLDPDDECSLRMLAAAVGSLAFVGDQVDFEADWEGDPDDCPTNFTWQLSGGLSATSALTGQRLTVRANTAGPGTITLFAGTNNRYSFKQDFTIR